MKALTTFLFLFLLSCSPAPTPLATNEITQNVITLPTLGIDGYLFEESQFASTSLTINIVRHKTYDSLRESYNGDLPKSIKLLGFTHYKFNNGKSKCTIHIIDPRVDYRPDIIGHELVHCMHGNFHPKKDKELRDGNDSDPKT